MLLAKNFNFADKNIYQNLKKVYGIGSGKFKQISQTLGLQPSLKQLKNNQIFKLLEFLEKQNNTTGSQLLKKEKDNLNFLTKLKNARGIRNKLGLPSRGQRTKTKKTTKITNLGTKTKTIVEFKGAPSYTSGDHT